MKRSTRLKILLGACIIGTIGILVDSTLLIIAAVGLVLFSAIQYRQTPPTNYTEIYGPPDDEDNSEPPATPFNVELPPEDREMAEPESRD